MCGAGRPPTIQIGDENTNWERQPMKYPAGIFRHDPIRVQLVQASTGRGWEEVSLEAEWSGQLGG